MKATPEQQQRLMDVHELDTRLAQLDHRERSLPEAVAVTQAAAAVDDVHGRLVRARTLASDVALEVQRAETDVQRVRERRARSQSLLDAGSGPAKELLALQHELDTLQRRQAELEDTELEVMERSEGLQSEVASLETEEEAAQTAHTAAVQARDEALAAVAAERTTVTEQRSHLAGTVPAELLAFYDKVRGQVRGPAVGLLAMRRCGACGLELNAADLSRLKAAAKDDVIRCEECRAILVRTPESGL